MDLDDFVESGGLEEVDPYRSFCYSDDVFNFLYFSFVAQSTKPKAEMERPRTYDLHIVYDKYYQVYFSLVGNW